MDGTHAFWGMTINNYDETDVALLQQGYPDFIRQLIYTYEVGEQGTPHIQAYLKLYRQQRLSYVKKLFPRGNFKSLDNDEYRLNAQRYAQKLDKTADSPAVINNNPFPDPVVELLSVITDALETYYEESEWTHLKESHFMKSISMIQNLRVAEKPGLAKFYVSAQYRSIKKEFWISLVQNVINTHTHTHTDEILSHEGGITEDANDTEENSSQHSQGEDSESEYNEESDSETNEGHSQSSGSSFDEEDD